MDVKVKVKTENPESEEDKEADVKGKVKEINLFVLNEEELGSGLIKDDVVDFDDLGEYMCYYFDMRYYFDVKDEIDVEKNQGSKDET